MTTMNAALSETIALRCSVEYAGNGIARPSWSDGITAVDDGNRIDEQQSGKVTIETHVKAVERPLAVTSRTYPSITAGYRCTVEFQFSSTEGAPAAAEVRPLLQLDCSALELNVVFPVGVGDGGNGIRSSQWRLSKLDGEEGDDKEFAAFSRVDTYRPQLVTEVCFTLAGVIVLTTVVVVAVCICSKLRSARRRRRSGCMAPPTVARTSLPISDDIETARLSVAAVAANGEGIYEKLIRSEIRPPSARLPRTAAAVGAGSSPREIPRRSTRSRPAEPTRPIAPTQRPGPGTSRDYFEVLADDGRN
jgi:hypothetical protein